MSGSKQFSRRWDCQPETERDARFFGLREAGYGGPVDQDGYAVGPAGADVVDDVVIDAVVDAARAGSVRRVIGPRRPGMVCRAVDGLAYRVDEVLVGAEARVLICWSDVAIIETDLDGDLAGRRRMHCTAWDAERDVVLDSPVAVGRPCPFCGLPADGSEYREQVAELRVWHARTRCAQAPVDRVGRPRALAEVAASEQHEQDVQQRAAVPAGCHERRGAAVVGARWFREFGRYRGWPVRLGRDEWGRRDVAVRIPGGLIGVAFGPVPRPDTA